ncbi:hypothetical protein [Nibribacter koreensis]|uniref:Uncharacterized protein n=1 Tax=Nibribacter koreensis TaxID=1084519 RepID=A0ABP8FB46_9BACT
MEHNNKITLDISGINPNETFINTYNKDIEGSIQATHSAEKPNVLTIAVQGKNGVSTSFDLRKEQAIEWLSKALAIAHELI